MQRSVSCAVLCIKRTMPRVRSCPARMHTTPLLAPVAQPWAVVAAHARSRVVDDAYLVSVRLARAVEGHRSARPTTLKLQSMYPPLMSEPPPALEDLPCMEYKTPAFFFLEKKVHELGNAYINKTNLTGAQKCKYGRGLWFQASGIAAVEEARDCQHQAPDARG
jgi:hypothetical protein